MDIILNLDARILAKLLKVINSSSGKTRRFLVSGMCRLTGFSKEKSEEALSAIIQVLEREYPDVFEEPPLS